MTLQITLRRSFPLLLFLVLSTAAMGQSDSPFMLGSAGSSATVGDITIMWTVGEFAVSTLTNGESVITQGFHQPSDKTTSVPSVVSTLPIVSVRPNPVSDELFIDLPESSRSGVQVELVDMLGQQVLVGSSESGDASVRLDVSTIPSGVYAVRLTLGEEIQNGMITIRR